jgi:hypothetical protein
MKTFWDLRIVLFMLSSFALGAFLIFKAFTNYPIVAWICLGVMVVAILVRLFQIKIRDTLRGWRVRCVSAGRWAYEERRGSEWLGITFEELGDVREPPHLLGIPDPESWRSLPGWLSARRDEVVSRLKRELKGYEIKNA